MGRYNHTDKIVCPKFLKKHCERPKQTKSSDLYINRLLNRSWTIVYFKWNES